MTTESCNLVRCSYTINHFCDFCKRFCDSLSHFYDFVKSV
nr:MAG TPA: Spliceosomal U1 small nuclear ribonucleoprotein [Caudoviricetes sp.]